MLKDLLLATFTPNRRLPVFLFLGLKVVLIVMTSVLYINAPEPGQTAGGVWLALQALLLWASFCLLANRFHDGGTSAIYLLPIFVLAGVVFMIKLDPSIVSADEDVQQMWTHWLFLAQRPIGMLALAIIGLALKLPTETGRNDYGMEFGEDDWVKKPDLGGKGLPAQAESIKVRRNASSRIAPVEHDEPRILSEVSWPQNGPSRRSGFGQR